MKKAEFIDSVEKIKELEIEENSVKELLKALV